MTEPRISNPMYESTSATRPRKGGALVEFVICLPVFLTIAIGTIESCRMIYIRQSVQIAAYECARLSITPGVAIEDVEDLAYVLVTGRGLAGHSLVLSTDNLSELEYGDLLAVTVAVPVIENTVFGRWSLNESSIDGTVTIMAEY